MYFQADKDQIQNRGQGLKNFPGNTTGDVESRKSDIIGDWHLNLGLWIMTGAAKAPCSTGRKKCFAEYFDYSERADLIIPQI